MRLQDRPDDDEDGYILQVDHHYPTNLHDQHDDYPLAPESLVIDRSMYSPTQQSVFPESAPQTKLTPNLQDKVKYAVHYRNLKLYIKLGLVVTRVHLVLAFKQSPWLKTYIGLNTRQRTLAGSCSFFKLMSNGVNVELVTDARLLHKRVANQTNFIQREAYYRAFDCRTEQNSDSYVLFM